MTLYSRLYQGDKRNITASLYDLMLLSGSDVSTLDRVFAIVTSLAHDNPISDLSEDYRNNLFFFLRNAKGVIFRDKLSLDKLPGTVTEKMNISFGLDTAFLGTDNHSCLGIGRKVHDRVGISVGHRMKITNKVQSYIENIVSYESRKSVWIPWLPIDRLS